ncbi:MULTISPECIES: hypothetical protein [Pseudomonas]|uniref:Uncharacterized protein n=1 Tax=Pseudomonas donghuensis TaxID=1163398 RepID=A0AAP0XBB3_9PSED|nr:MULTISPECIES: hypothetical protein [Pseudomonas]MDF9893699.1 hypothetical protein [Pseudomonas vranovensis]KDN96953.1 hypothetical protein BV82_5162 [Pseudomonas donghuensis]MBF4210240.1 hypothetical protein [Pseudomonas donghuensis]MBS7601264.1 hypothetical protein [Pseudomonas sp. RC2C2]MCP6692451.1 hypothetical protein [Pseudomonas donghuensis]
MNEAVKSQALTQDGPLAFTSDKGVSPTQLEKFVATVDLQAAEVARGLLDSLKKEGVKARVEQRQNQYLIIQESLSPSVAELAAVDPNSRPSRIRLFIRSADAPPTINALRLFFRDWRAVAGLVAVGTAWQAGQWLMTVRRREGPTQH